jgi:hypothetical protein
MILFSPGFALGCTRTGNYGPNIPAGIRKKILQGQLLHRNACKGNLLLNQPFWLVALMPTPMRFQLLANQNLGQTDILCDRPHDGQATGLSRKGVNLISAPSNVAKQTLDGVSTPNVAVHPSE